MKHVEDGLIIDIDLTHISTLAVHRCHSDPGDSVGMIINHENKKTRKRLGFAMNLNLHNIASFKLKEAIPLHHFFISGCRQGGRGSMQQPIPVRPMNDDLNSRGPGHVESLSEDWSGREDLNLRHPAPKVGKCTHQKFTSTIIGTR
ncbi:MAG: hypothetical protein D6690_04950 [Nitrospirae bacterium]|nr:MAG: hypothetical protein D6690_04950 [Nitrospirota bacterium]